MLSSLNPSIVMNNFTLILALLASLNVLVHSTGTQEYDLCGVDGEKILEYDYIVDHNVAGDGCTLGNKTNCICAMDYEDQSAPLPPFKWLCGTVEFGPKGNKTCPTTIPIVKSIGSNSSNGTEVMVECNTTLHPKGYPGDEGCGYSECENGGDYSALCGCVDFSEHDFNTTEGMQWICLYSACNCPVDENNNATTNGSNTNTTKGSNTTATNGSSKMNSTTNTTSAAVSMTQRFFLAGAVLALIGTTL